MDRAIDAEGVGKTYGETVALDDVSLSVAAGEVLALVGPNGAGKTTLVRALTGTTEPDGGEIRVLGEPPRDVDRAALGVLPQDFTPPERLTARELVEYYAGLYDDARDADDVLEEVGLQDDPDRHYEALSGGQQRRVCLGAALVNDPQLLVLDEPTAGIDPAGRRTVRGVVDDLAAGGATVLLTTHDMQEAERLADRVALLADGRLRAAGTPTEVVEEHGGAPRLVVDLADAAQREGAVEALADVGIEVGAGVGADAGDAGDRRGRELVVPGVDPASVGDAVDALASAGVPLESVAWRRPTLEDAFLALADESSVGASDSGRGSPAADGSVATSSATDDVTMGPDTSRADAPGGDGS